MFMAVHTHTDTYASKHLLHVQSLCSTTLPHNCSATCSLKHCDTSSRFHSHPSGLNDPSDSNPAAPRSWSRAYSLTIPNNTHTQGTRYRYVPALLAWEGSNRHYQTNAYVIRHLLARKTEQKGSIARLLGCCSRWLCDGLFDRCLLQCTCRALQGMIEFGLGSRLSRGRSWYCVYVVHVRFRFIYLRCFLRVPVCLHVHVPRTLSMCGCVRIS